MQQLRRDNLTAIVKPCVKQVIEGFECDAFFKRLSYAEMQDVQRIAASEAEGDNAWNVTCDLVARTVFEDADGQSPVWAEAAAVAEHPPAFVGAVVSALMAANGAGTQQQVKEITEKVKND